MSLSTSSDASGEDRLDDVAMHVGQAALNAIVVVCQFLVIQSEQVQDGGMQVVDVDHVLDGGVAELVAGAVDQTDEGRKKLEGTKGPERK